MDFFFFCYLIVDDANDDDIDWDDDPAPSRQKGLTHILIISRWLSIRAYCPVAPLTWNHDLNIKYKFGGYVLGA